MALLEAQLVVKKSSIPGAGKGLFTKKTIPKGVRITEYKGRKTTWKDANHDEGRNLYIFFVTRLHVIDASNYKKVLARYVNDARGLSKIKGVNNNCCYVTEGLRVYLESTKEIPAHAEIFAGYGKEYWDVIRKNAKIDTLKR